MSDPHPGTCICTDCLPGGAREHRVRPYGGVDPNDCVHGVNHTGRGRIVTRAEVRFRVALIGGGALTVCRLCGTVVDREAL